MVIADHVVAPGFARQMAAIGASTAGCEKAVEEIRMKVAAVPLEEASRFRESVERAQPEVVELLCRLRRFDEALGECRVWLLVVSPRFYQTAVGQTADVLRRADGNLGRALEFLDFQRKGHVPKSSNVLFAVPRLLDMAQSVPAGLDALRTLVRAECATPVICLLGRNAPPDTRAICLDAGADDAIARPWDNNELRARIAAVHRRMAAPAERQTLRFGDLVMDTHRHSVQRNGRKIFLAALEYRLLNHFMRHPERVTTPEILAEHVWEQSHVTLNTIRVRICGLRKKINAPGETPLIHSVKDIGYILKP